MVLIILFLQQFHALESISTHQKGKKITYEIETIAMIDNIFAQWSICF
jgi:hypothetical protein